MTTHVFVVDVQTFPVHLRHRFAGTGAKDHRVDFNNSSRSDLHHSPENNLVGMIADINRVRKGDSIIFYVQQKQGKGMPEGKFYGIFRATQDYPFIDDNDGNQYLKSDLGKSLTFRALFEPDRVYPKGVTEWEALDEIKDISKPNQMLWSLIYRKLKGNRGCTMITEYEQERLCLLLDRKNAGNSLDCTDKTLGFNPANQQIVCADEGVIEYAGRKESINLMPRLVQKHSERKSFEAHLQADIVGRLGRNADSLTRILTGDSDSEIEWLGNEVSCGVGMQRIDVMLAFVKNRIRYIAPIELKSVPLHASNITQVQRYVDWVEQYYLPNLPSIITPTLITLKPQTRSFSTVLDEVHGFNERNSGSTCEKLQLVEFEVSNSELRFSLNKY